MCKDDALEARTDLGRKSSSESSLAEGALRPVGSRRLRGPSVPEDESSFAAPVHVEVTSWGHAAPRDGAEKPVELSGAPDVPLQLALV